MVFVEHVHNLMSQIVTNDLRSQFRMKNLFLGRITLSVILVAVMATGVLGQTKKILIAGDSIVKGEVGSSPVGGFRDNLDNLLTGAGFVFDFVGGEVDGSGFDADHEGHSGWTSDSIDVNIQGWLNSFDPDEVLLLIGTNDISLGVPNATIIANLTSIIDKIFVYDNTTKIYLSALIPRLDEKDGAATSLNVSIESLVSVKKGQGVDILFTDPNAAFKANPSWPTDYMFDNLHPINLGYFIMAQVYFQIITFDPFADLVESDPFDDAGVFAQDWNANSSDFQVSGGRLVNTASVDAWYMAVYQKFTNPTEVAMILAPNVDPAGVEGMAFGLRLNGFSTSADGYFLRFKSSQTVMELWELQGGTPVGLITSLTPASPIPTANDTFRVGLTSDDNGHHFDVFVNNQFSGRLTDSQKLYDPGTWYSGIILSANESNDVDEFVFTRFSDVLAPAAITDLRVVSASGNSILLSWTATGDDAFTGRASAYDLRFSTQSITENNFSSTAMATGLPAPNFSGTTQSFFVPDLNAKATYFFALKVRDEVGNTSSISNIASGATLNLNKAIDDFESATMFANRWVAGPEYRVNNGEMENTSNDNGFQHLAVFKNVINPLEVEFQYGVNAQGSGAGDPIESALALMLSDTSTTADGYFARKKDNLIELWEIVGGTVVGQIIGRTGNLPAPAPGDTLKVAVTSDDAGHHFDFFINDQVDGRLTDALKLHGNEAITFGGVLLRGQGGSINNIDNFAISAIAEDPTSFILVAGNNQQGIVGKALTDSLVVKALDQFGNPVPGLQIVFTVTQGNGTVQPLPGGNFMTDSEGQAKAIFTLGPAVGTDTVEASLPEFGLGPLSFSATAAPDVPSKLVNITSTTLNGTSNMPLVDSVEVKVEDQFGNPRSNHSVTFTVTLGGGLVNGSATPKIIQTNANGIAKVQWILGPNAGQSNNKLEASASFNNQQLTGSPLEFVASTAPGTASDLIKVSGDSSSGVIQTSLAAPFVVKVTDGINPLAGWPVTFTVIEGGGKLGGADSKVVQTNASGEASAILTLGNTSGLWNNAVEATAANSGPLNGSPIRFVATATANNATQLTLVAGGNQNGEAGLALSDTIQIKIADDQDNGVPDHPVTIKISSGGGTINGTAVSDTAKIIPTDQDGIALVTWNLGGAIGTNSQSLLISANDGVNELGGSPLIVFANATAGPVDANSSTITSDKTHVLANGQEVATIRITLNDKFGNPKSGKAVLIMSSGSNNFVSQPPDLTDANGQAVGSIASTVAEIKSVTVRNVTDSFNLNTSLDLTFIALNPDKVQLSKGDGQAGNVGTALDEPLEVIVSDQNNNPVVNVEVTFRVTGGDGQMISSFSSTPEQSVIVKTDNQGKASAIWIVGPNPGPNSAETVVVFDGVPLTGSPRSFSATGLTTTATIMKIFDGNNQVGGIAGGTLDIPLQIKVTDANGKPVFNMPVDFEIQLGGGQLAIENPVSDYRGIAETRFTLGPIVGTNIVEASNASLSGSPKVFTFQSVIGPPTILRDEIGDGGNAVVNSLYPIAAKIMDVNENPIEGVYAAFEVVQGNASIEGPQSIQTDAAGLAQTQVRLPTSVGTVVVKVTSIDLPGFFDTFTITATPAAAANISLFAGNDQDGTVGRELVFPFQALITDPFGNPVSGYQAQWVRTIGTGSPSNTSTMTDDRGIASLAYTIGSQTGTNEVRAVTALNPPTVTFTATGVTNNFPLFSGLDDKSVVEGSELRFEVNANDADGDPMTFEVQNLPSGALFDASSGTFTFNWTPAIGSHGDFEVTFVVRDNRSGLDSETITISVQNSNNPPVVNSFTPSELNPQFEYGDIIKFSVNVVDPDGDEINFLWQLFTDINSNGILVSTSSDFEFITSNFDLGTYIIRVDITDGRDTEVIEWRIDLVTSVELASFTAQFAGFDGVEIAWVTSRETDNLGFDVLRSRSENGTYTKINDELIPPNPNSEYRYVDKDVLVGIRFYYILEDVNVNGVRTQHGPISVDITSPETFQLSQNYPNPFNPETKIRYQLPNSGKVAIKVFNVLGRQVRVLVNEKKDAGFHEVIWNARDDSGLKVSTGIYYYLIIAGEFKETKKMVLLK